MYTIVEKENFNIYVFDKIHMNIKIIDNGASKRCTLITKDITLYLLCLLEVLNLSAKWTQ